MPKQKFDLDQTVFLQIYGDQKWCKRKIFSFELDQTDMSKVDSDQKLLIWSRPNCYLKNVFR